MAMDIRFDGQRALVTGAGKGIGRGLVVALAELGADVYAISRTQSDLDSLKEECPSIHVLALDVGNWDATRKAVQDILAEGPIDLLVNNAAVLHMVSMLNTSREQLEEIFDVNVKAMFNITQVVGESMVKRGKGGSIVNLSSIAGKIALIHAGAYCTSKGAVEQMTRMFALELGPHQIKVNSVNPTAVYTPMGDNFLSDPPGKVEPLIQRTPLRRFANVVDIVRPVLYLLSDKSDMITATALMVDGGLVAT